LIFSLVEVRQEKIKSKGELQVRKGERASASFQSARQQDAEQGQVDAERGNVDKG